MKTIEIEILHYNRKREQVDISSAESKNHIKQIVEDTINKVLFG